MQHWYVYYKLDLADRSAHCERVHNMQQQIAQTTALRVRLLERTEPGETTTVMEVYEDIADAERFAAVLDNAVRAHLPASHAGGRRIERFRDA